ncbi:hypothetical protein STEG23_007972 [Scotinomys teguina]
MSTCQKRAPDLIKDGRPGYQTQVIRLVGGSQEGPQLQHELVTPQWRTSESPGRGKHPLTAELRVTAEGRELILDLEKNEYVFVHTHVVPGETTDPMSANYVAVCFGDE